MVMALAQYMPPSPEGQGSLAHDGEPGKLSPPPESHLDSEMKLAAADSSTGSGAPSSHASESGGGGSTTSTPSRRPPLYGGSPKKQGHAGSGDGDVLEALWVHECVDFPSWNAIEMMLMELRVNDSPEERADRRYEVGLHLIGHGRDIRKASVAYANTLKWRAAVNADRVREQVRGGMPPHAFPCAKAIEDAFPHLLCGVGTTCVDGSPLAVSRIGRVDMKRLVNVVKVEHFQTYMMYVMEARLWYLERLARTTRRVQRFLDVHDFSQKNQGIMSLNRYMEYFRCVSNNLSPHYPEQVRRILLVNMPPVLKGAWSVARMLTADRTREKIKIVCLRRDNNPLVAEVPAPSLPCFLGGTRVCLMSPKETHEMRLARMVSTDSDSEASSYASAPARLFGGSPDGSRAGTPWGVGSRSASIRSTASADSTPNRGTLRKVTLDEHHVRREGGEGGEGDGESCAAENEAGFDMSGAGVAVHHSVASAGRKVRAVTSARGGGGAAGGDDSAGSSAPPSEEGGGNRTCVRHDDDGDDDSVLSSDDATTPCVCVGGAPEAPSSAPTRPMPGTPPVTLGPSSRKYSVPNLQIVSRSPSPHPPPPGQHSAGALGRHAHPPRWVSPSVIDVFGETAVSPLSSLGGVPPPPDVGEGGWAGGVVHRDGGEIGMC